jgi:peptide/nickel transport system permease protein
LPRWRRAFSNLPLLFGSLLIGALFLLVVFGPGLATMDPYLGGRAGVSYHEGKLVVPPYSPSPEYPLGTDPFGQDLLSLILMGARNTLVMATFVAMTRLIVGLFLGSIAGWYLGSLFDRAVMGLIEANASFPALLSGMILIFALGIRRGMIVFIAALCLVGWGEIAQQVRGQFALLKRKPFVEGARAVGLSDLEIAVRHILPNALPSLIAIAPLEMGAVLMLVGELGFLEVYIGGGIERTGDLCLTPSCLIPNIAEWGSMLGAYRKYFYSHPVMMLAPATAFFVAVLGFNLLGEGLRRVVERREMKTAFLLSGRMILVIALVTLGAIYTMKHVGPAPSYAKLATRFDVQEALKHIEALTSVEMGGREAGRPGGEAAARYIASRFREYGYQRGWQYYGEVASPEEVYMQPFTTYLVRPLSPPELSLLDGDGQVVESYRRRIDFGEQIYGHGGSGEAQGSVALFLFDPRREEYPPEALARLDLEGKIALYLQDNAPLGFDREALARGAKALLVITEEVQPQNQLAFWKPEFRFSGPTFNADLYAWYDDESVPSDRLAVITPEMADSLLAPDGLSVASLQEQLDGMGSTWSPLAVSMDLSTKASIGGKRVPLLAILVKPKLSPLERSSVYELADLEGKAVLYFEANVPIDFEKEALARGAEAFIAISEEETTENFTFQPGEEYLLEPTIPILHITPKVAEDFLSADGLSLSLLRERLADWSGEEAWWGKELTAQGRVSVSLSSPQEVTAYNVLAMLPGEDTSLIPGTEHRLNAAMIIVSAHYDGWGEEDGLLYMGANESASGVATLLEIARLWKEYELEPGRTVLFALWAGSDWTYSGAEYWFDYFESRFTFSTFQVEAVIDLDRVGRGEPILQLSEGREDVVELLRGAARDLSCKVNVGATPPHSYQRYLQKEIGAVMVGWAPGEEEPPVDNVIDLNRLEKAGQVVNLALIRAVKEELALSAE